MHLHGPIGQLNGMTFCIVGTNVFVYLFRTPAYQHRQRHGAHNIGTLHGTLLHCLRAGGCEEFCAGLWLDHVGDAQEACGQQNWKNSAGTKIWAIGPHWTLDNGNGTGTTSHFSAYLSNFYGFTLSNAQVGPPTGVQAKSKAKPSA